MPGDLYGLDELLAALREQVAAVDRATPDGLGEAAHFLEGAVKITLTTTSHARGTLTPSRPGEPPSLITGHLRGSVEVDGPARRGEYRWEAQVGPTAVYARIQELGGVAGRGAYLPPRPYLAPSVDRARDRMGEIVAEHWADALE